MANNKPLITLAEKASDRFGKGLVQVMGELEKNLINIVSGTRTAAGEFNAQAILDSKTAMIRALDDSGYYDLAAAHVARYGDIPKEVSNTFKSQKIPAPKYTQADAETFRGLAQVDLDVFADIGEGAISQLHLGLYRQAVASEPLSNLVNTIRAATVGVDGKGSPMANHAYTHANTAILKFEGETLRIAGESIGFGDDDSLWEVVGPDDGSTRDICETALSKPVRTKAEWIAAGYWGGTPGGWNCRHQLFPYIGDK